MKRFESLNMCTEFDCGFLLFFFFSNCIGVFSVAVDAVRLMHKNRVTIS